MSDETLYKIRQANPELAIEFKDGIFIETHILLEDKCVAIKSQTLVQLGMSPPRQDFSVVNLEIIKEESYNITGLLQYIAHNKPLLNDNKKIQRYHGQERSVSNKSIVGRNTC